MGGPGAGEGKNGQADGTAFTDARAFGKVERSMFLLVCSTDIY